MLTEYLQQKWLLFPGAVHIDEKKDFTPVIEKALELGGYKEDQTHAQASAAVRGEHNRFRACSYSHANTVVEAVKIGPLSAISSWLPAVMVPNQVETIIRNS